MTASRWLRAVVLALVATGCQNEGEDARPTPSATDARVETCVVRVSDAVASDLRSGGSSAGLALQRETGQTGREYRTYSAVVMNDSFQRAKARGHDEALKIAAPIVRGGCSVSS